MDTRFNLYNDIHFKNKIVLFFFLLFFSFSSVSLREPLLTVKSIASEWFSCFLVAVLNEELFSTADITSLLTVNITPFSILALTNFKAASDLLILILAR